MSRAQDLTGQKFGRLEVLSRAGTDKNRRALWRCRCRCLKTIEVSTSDLRRGKIVSCGCATPAEDNLKLDRERRLWRTRRDVYIDRHDGFDPQIPDWKFVELHHWSFFQPNDSDWYVAGKKGNALKSFFLPREEEAAANDLTLNPGRVPGRCRR